MQEMFAQIKQSDQIIDSESKLRWKSEKIAEKSMINENLMTSRSP